MAIFATILASFRQAFCISDWRLKAQLNEVQTRYINGFLTFRGSFVSVAVIS
ncbi:hypothetical protein V2H45_12990 [Tumidithrix elongata RA019]|uniref:Uncharacterized protein n=1 Tax=Tumidithrix elongata BACA0141 TaxID=2716417 RepID=A0AAW9Q0D9_9CYAN|nr:hypothetical protein [Tumidithrix elongata RA019]